MNHPNRGTFCVINTGNKATGGETGVNTGIGDWGLGTGDQGPMQSCRWQVESSKWKVASGK